MFITIVYTGTIIYTYASGCYFCEEKGFPAAAIFG